MIGFGALAEPSFLDLDEIADLGAFLQHRAGPQPRERPDLAARRDGRALDVAEGADGRALVDDDAGAEDDVRLDRAVAAELRVMAEPDAFRIDQGRALLERFLAAA